MLKKHVLDCGRCCVCLRLLACVLSCVRVHIFTPRSPYALVPSTCPANPPLLLGIRWLCFDRGVLLSFWFPRDQTISTKKSPAMFSFGLGRAELDKKEKGGGKDTPGPDYVQPEGLGKQVCVCE